LTDGQFSNGLNAMSDDAPLIDQLIAIFSHVLGRSVAFDLDRPLADMVDLDSFKYIEILVEIEQTFAFQFPSTALDDVVRIEDLARAIPYNMR
jgi:acyl carrier protein